MPSVPPAPTWREHVIPALPDQAWLKDIRSRFLAVSRSFAEACGATPEAMIGRTEAAFFPTARVERFRDDDRRAIAWGRPIVVLEGAGRSRFLTFKAPVRDEIGRVVGTVGVAIPGPGARARATGMRRTLFPGALGTRAPTPPWLRRVRHHLETGFDAPVNVTQLAATVGRNPNYVTRAFRRRYGVSPVEYAHRRRVEWTAHRLATSDVPLCQLAQEAGFTDQSHMTRLFSRYFGITPGAYRDAMRTAAAPAVSTYPPT